MAVPSVPIDTRDVTVTPVFKYVTREDVNASEREHRPVMVTEEVVEVRFAGSKNYSPVFPVNAQWKRDGHKVVTYAERWADQYRDFLAGNDQIASGTPLEMLKQYGITDSQLSLCRALKIYSIEALHHLEGPALKGLSMNGNVLKDMARKYMANLSSGTASLEEMQRLRDEIERLKSAIPAEEPGQTDIEEAIKNADDEYSSLSNDELKEKIALLAGRKPAGNPSRETLISSLKELEGVA